MELRTFPAWAFVALTLVATLVLVTSVAGVLIID